MNRRIAVIATSLLLFAQCSTAAAQSAPQDPSPSPFTVTNPVAHSVLGGVALCESMYERTDDQFWACAAQVYVANCGTVPASDAVASAACTFLRGDIARYGKLTSVLGGINLCRSMYDTTEPGLLRCLANVCLANFPSHEDAPPLCLAVYFTIVQGYGVPLLEDSAARTFQDVGRSISGDQR